MEPGRRTGSRGTDVPDRQASGTDVPGGQAPGARTETPIAAAAPRTLEQAFGAGELDLIFQYDNGIRALGPHAVVGHDRTVLVAAPSHPLARKEVVTPGEMLRYDFLKET